MIRHALFLGAALLMAACDTPADDITQAPQEGETGVAETEALPQGIAEIREAVAGENHGYAIVEGLTTDIGPRLAGTEAERRARDWTVAKFREIGLQNVRVEDFTIPGWIRGEERASLLAPFEQPLYVTALGGSVPTPPEGVRGEIAYFPTFDDLENAPLDLDLSGRIAFIDGRMERAPDGAGYGPANRKRRSGATEAGRRGAEAVIIRSVGTDSRRFPHTGQMNYGDDVAPIPIGALSSPDADQLERLLARGETLEVELLLTPQSPGELPSGNVIGEIVGSEAPDEIVLIGGHLDSWDQGTGAVDDGAGIGISAGAAQAIIEAGLTPKRTIRVVAFGAEEVGLLGAFAYARAHADELDNHVLASESDFGGERFYEVKKDVGSGDEVIARIAELLDVPLSPLPTNGGPDIIPLHNQGVPVMRLQQDGTDYFDLHHTPDDTLDKLDPEAIRQNVLGFATLAWMASEADTDFRRAGESERSQ